MDKSQLFLARRYAQAFLNVVYDQLQIADIVLFERAESFFKNHPQANFLLDLSLLDKENKQESLHKIVVRFDLPKLTEKLLSLIVAHKRSALIGDVLCQIIALYKERAGIIAFSIESSLPLSRDEKDHIENFLKGQVSAIIVCSYLVNPNLIAGVRIYNEKYLWEYSAQAQLRALATSIRR